MSRDSHADVLIVGAGAIGCSIGWELARRGAGKVVVLDRGKAGYGSSIRATGGLREQFSTEINIRFSQMSIPFFRNAVETLGGSIDYDEVGYIFLARSQEQASAFERNVALQCSLGVDAHYMIPDAMERNWPWINLEGVVGASWCPTDSLIDQRAYVHLLVDRTRDAGVDIREGINVSDLVTSGERVTGVRTDDGVLTADVVVLAAGAWSPPIAASVGLDLPVEGSRREIFTTTPVATLPERMPFVADFNVGGYVRRDADGFRVSGRLDRGASDNPEVNPAGGPPTLEWAASLIPEMARASLTGGWAGLTEVTPDHHALLGPVEGLDGLIVATGFSGHGLMHAPATGLLVGELILDGRAHSLDIDPLSPLRFERGQALSETMYAVVHEQGDIVKGPSQD